MFAKRIHKLFMVLFILALAACATTPKARYYQNLDMYDFVMTQVRTAYSTSTDAEKAQMDRELLPALNAWSKARLAWKASLNDATKEQAAMLAWAQAKAALLQFGVVSLKELDTMEGGQ